MAMVRFDPWVDTTGAGSDPELERIVAERIVAGGPMTFAAFMALALYHPQRGYYSTAAERAGRGGDFVTSPEVHPVFGALVARQLAELHDALGAPGALRIVEPGAGNGTLARDVLAALARAAPGVRIDYVIVEPRERARVRQAATLGDAPARWVTRLDELAPAAATVVLSNELLDAFPVHRVAVRDGALRELYVESAPHGGFVTREGELSTPAIAAYFEALALLPGEGCVAEVNLEAARWIAGAAAIIDDRGFVLTFDYGGSAAEVYAPWRRDGTLLCGYQQVAGADPYVRIGRQDMTAHVDFTTLVREGREHGLEPLGYARQAEVLAALGIGEGLAGPGEGPQALERYAARRQAAIELLDPAGLGRIRVLLQGKGIGARPFAGFPGGPPERI